MAYFGSPFKALTYFMNALSGDTAGKVCVFMWEMNDFLQIDESF